MKVGSRGQLSIVADFPIKKEKSFVAHKERILLKHLLKRYLGYKCTNLKSSPNLKFHPEAAAVFPKGSSNKETIKHRKLAALKSVFETLRK